MQIISPSAELWFQPEGEEAVLAHIARCARVCRQVKNPKRSDKELCDSLVKMNHLSMFRHATYYFAIPNTNEHNELRSLVMALTASTMAGFIARAYSKRHKMFLFAINGHTMLEFSAVNLSLLTPYQITADRIAEYAKDESRNRKKYILGLLRTTVCCITQISTSREMNRTSPNNIVEQSTRYVNFGKRGGITICKPHWYDSASRMKRFFTRCCWQVQEWMYLLALKFLKPEDARGFLPLDTATRVVYTYTNKEWKHIMDLRLRETTGPAHPNAKIIASLIQDEVNNRNSMLSDYEI